LPRTDRGFVEEFSSPFSMADILITAVSATYTGSTGQDDFSNHTGNLRDITVAGLSGDDLLHFGSAAQAGTGAGGVGLGFSLGSSDIRLGAGDDTMTFSGQAGSGFAKFEAVVARAGAGDDFLVINALQSASGSTVRGNEGNDEITFASDADAASANDVVLNANAGADSVSAVWTGTEAAGFTVRGGSDNDTIRTVFSAISAVSGGNGVAVRGNKGDDSIFFTLGSAGVGVASGVQVNGNSGADTIAATAAADVADFNVVGGRGNDSVSAVYVNNITALDSNVRGNLGNDTVVLTLQSGGFASGLSVDGGSGDDAVTLNVNSAAAFAFGSANSILGGTGADTINVNVAGDMNVTGASGMVVELGAAGTVSAGTAGVGGTINLNLSAAMSGGGIVFRGTDTADTFNISDDASVTGGALNGVVFSAEEGADTISIDLNTGGLYSAFNVDGGSGGDVITASFGGQTLFNAATGGQVSVQGGAGNDTIIVNAGINTAGGTVSAGFFAGNDGDDVLTINLASAGNIGNQNSGSQFFGGSGTDTIGFSIGSGASAAADIQAGSGNDLITATLQGFGATAGTIQGTTALAGAGNDTIAITVVAAETGGAQVMSGGEGSVFNGGDGTDSITMLGTVASAGTFQLGEAQGGAGSDTITIGSTLASTGTTLIYGAFNGGAGADSLVFSGNNIVSGAVSTFLGAGSAGSGGFVLGSGDSLIDGFDTVFVSNEAITGGQAQRAGTFASAGILFENMTGGEVGSFNMSVATAGARSLGLSAGQAIFLKVGGTAGNQELDSIGISKNGFIMGLSAGADGAAGGSAGGAFVASGGSTTAQIFSAVEGLLAGRGQAAVFNIQGGSAGSVDGFLYVDNGGVSDTIIKFAGNGQNVVSETNTAGMYFHSNTGGALITHKTVNAQSGGSIFLGSNVGLG
jgi:hypothetical protein